MVWCHWWKMVQGKCVLLITAHSADPNKFCQNYFTRAITLLMVSCSTLSWAYAAKWHGENPDILLILSLLQEKFTPFLWEKNIHLDGKIVISLLEMICLSAASMLHSWWRTRNLVWWDTIQQYTSVDSVHIVLLIPYNHPVWVFVAGAFYCISICACPMPLGPLCLAYIHWALLSGTGAWFVLVHVCTLWLVYSIIDFLPIPESSSEASYVGDEGCFPSGLSHWWSKDSEWTGEKPE